MASENVPEDDAVSRELNRLLPIANICRIMKKKLPVNSKVAKDAKDIIQESNKDRACDRIKEEKRKTITGEDVLDAFQALGFDEYLPCLELYLTKYRASLKKESGHKVPKTNHSAVAVTSENDGTGSGRKAKPTSSVNKFQKPALMDPKQILALIDHLRAQPVTPEIETQLNQLISFHTQLVAAHAKLGLSTD